MAAGRLILVMAGGIRGIQGSEGPATGDGGAKPAETLAGLKETATGGDAKAQFQLGTEYWHGSSRTPMKQDQATHWLNRAAEGGHTDAMVFLAKLLRAKGSFIDVDTRRSFELTKRAAEKGHVEGMDLLAEAYFNNLGVGNMPAKERNKLAVKWLKKAAAEGAFRARVQLGDSYRKGKFLERDGEKAVKWYKKALQTADKLNRTSAQKISPQAAEMIQKVHITLGEMSYKGHGTKKNTSVALRYFRRAAELGGDTVTVEKLVADMEKKLQVEEVLNDPDVENLLKEDPMLAKAKERGALPKETEGQIDKLLKQLTESEL